MSSTAIIKCPKCGQKLRVPSDRGPVYVTCPKCGVGGVWPKGSTAILTVVTDVDNKSPRGKPVARKYRSHRPARRWVGFYTSIGVVILLAVGFLRHYEFTYVPPKPLPLRESCVQDPNRPVWNPPPEEALPDNGDGVFRFDRSESRSKLRIVPRSESGHIVVKVEDWNDSQLVCWFLIREGQSAETPIPPGTYRLKFACGKRWYGKKHLFGPEASYSAIANEISIPANTDLTLHLTPRMTGTFRENRIGSADF